MKKLSIIAIAAAALASAACTQERNIVPADSGVTTVTATHFAASTRSSLKADLSGETPAYEILWDTPDKILVGYPGAVATFTSTNTEPAAEATFTGKLPEGSGTLYGIYPAKASNKVNSDGSFSIAFKAEQKAVPGSYDPESFPAVAESRSKDLSFQNICSLLALTVEDEGIVTITLKGNGGACFYGGTFTVVTASGEPEIDDFTEDVYEITLTADGTFDPEETYYMSVPPITFADGVVFTLTYEDVTTADVVLANEVTAERSKVHEVPALGNGTDTNGVDCVEMAPGFFVATCNVGAENPEDAGGLFAWAETEPKDPEGYAAWSNYKWMTSGVDAWNGVNKYTIDDGLWDESNACVWYRYDEESEDYVFIGDNGDGVEHKGLGSYNYEDDAARAALGGDWRTLSLVEWNYLISSEFTWEWTGAGYTVTSNVEGCEGNSIFLPVTNYIDGDGLEEYECGYYWLSDQKSYSDYAIYGYLYDSSVWYDSVSRYYGFAVRGACGKLPPKKPYTISGFQNALYFHNNEYKGYTIAFLENDVTSISSSSSPTVYTDGKWFKIDVPEEIMNSVVDDMSGNLDGAGWYFYFSSDSFGRYRSGDFKSGSLKVMLDEENGTVDFEIDAVTYDGLPVQGSYSGSVEAVDSYFYVATETAMPAPRKGPSSSIQAGVNAPEESHHSRVARNDRK